MKQKLKELLKLLSDSPRKFPVEAALGVVFYIIAILETLPASSDIDVDGDILHLSFQLIVLSFWLRRVNRWAYFASFFVFVPLMAIDLTPFLWTEGYFFTFLLALVLLIVDRKRMDNRPFVAHAIHVITQLLFGMVIIGLLTLAVAAVVASFCYIFTVDPENLLKYTLMFVWFVLSPLVCCTLITQNEYDVTEPSKALKIILNYILSPTVIVYTLILYVYFVKIVLEWDLPIGGLAWMVMAYIAVALAGYMAQSVLTQRYYDWFYKPFPFIAIAPLIMFWVGAVYRIRMYGFTESRFYLLLAGVLMTLFILMLFHERTRRFQWMAVIFGVAIALFTYIPGISAKSIGLRCQEERMTAILGELNMTDAKTGKINCGIDLGRIKSDEDLTDKFLQACDIVGYVRSEMGHDEFKEKYGEWTLDRRSVIAPPTEQTYYTRREPVALGEYDVALSNAGYRCRFKGKKVTVSLREGPVVVEYPIVSIFKADSTLLIGGEQLFVYRNDSIMLILNNLTVCDNEIQSVDCNDYLLFRKSSK